jgi:hypothetical protein
MGNADAGAALMSFMVNTSWSIACATMILGATGNTLASMICFMCLMCFGMIGIAAFISDPPNLGGAPSSSRASAGDPYTVAFLFMIFFWPLGVCLLVCGLILAMVRSVK